MSTDVAADNPERSSKAEDELAKLLGQYSADAEGNYKAIDVVAMCQHMHHELLEHTKHERALAGQSKVLKKLVIGAVIVTLTMLIINAVIVVGTAELLKDTVMSGNQMRSKSGDVVQTASSDFFVTGGKLVVRPEVEIGGNRRLSTCPEDVTCADTGEDETLQTQPKPLQTTKISSTAPDAFLGELKDMKLSNPRGETISVPVVGYQRKMSPSNSKCGSILILNTPHGVISLDDYDIILSEDVKIFLRASNFDFQETLTANGRRLSAGHDVAGLFQFFMDYEWNCTSYAEPLQHLKPPYMFVLETRVLCPDECKSSVFTDYDLPGMVKERTVGYIATKETVYAFGDIIISYQEYPSHPGIKLMTYTNAAQNVSRKQTDTFGTIHSCSENGIPVEENIMTKFDIYKIAVVGDVTRNGTTYRRYRIVSTIATSDAERDRTTVEFWEESLSEQPYKYFMPGVPSASISYFKSFTKQDLSMDMADRLSRRFNVSCGSHFGPNARKDGFLEENEETLKWYKQHYEANPASLDEVPERDRAYFERVKDMYVEPPRASKPRRRMRTASEDSELNQQALTPRRLGDLSLEEEEVEGAVCPFEFKLGGEDGFELKICKVISPEGMKFQGSVSTPEIKVGVFKFAATGEIAYVYKNLEDPDKSPCCFEGKIELEIGIEVDVLFVFKLSVTLKGSLMFKAKDDGNAKMEAELGLAVAVKLFGLNIGASVTGSVKLEIDNFGLETATIAWKYGVTLEINLAVFKITVPWTGNIIPKQKFQSGTYASNFNWGTPPGIWTEPCRPTLHFCDNDPVNNDQRCNQWPWKFVAYATGAEANCSWGEKRCFCKNQALIEEDEARRKRGYEWSPCFADIDPSHMGFSSSPQLPLRSKPAGYFAFGRIRKFCAEIGLSHGFYLPPDGEFEWKYCEGAGIFARSGKCVIVIDEKVDMKMSAARAPVQIPPSPPAPGYQGFRGEPGPPGMPGPRGDSCNQNPSSKEVKDWMTTQEGQIIQALNQVAWMTTSFQDNVVGTIPDAQREPQEAMQHAKKIDQVITELSDKYIKITNDVSATFANQLSELESDLLFSQPIASLRRSKATSFPCGPCKWPQRTFQIISGHGLAFESKGPRQKVAMGGVKSSPTMAAQQWTFTANKTLKSSDGSCVDFSNEYANGGGVGVWDCHRGPNQLIVYSSLTKQLKTVWGNQCLDFNAEWQNLGSWSCSGGVNQEWTLRELDQGKTPMNCPETCTWPEQQLHVISHRDGLALQAIPGHAFINLGVPNAAFGDQLFTWNPDSLQLQTGQGQGKKCVAMTGQSDGAKLRLADCDPSVDDAEFQVFMYIEADKMIKHFYLNLCLDNGGQGVLHLWACSRTNVNQKFELV